MICIPSIHPKSTLEKNFSKPFTLHPSYFLTYQESAKDYRKTSEIYGTHPRNTSCQKNNNFKPPEPRKNKLSTTRCSVILLRYLNSEFPLLTPLDTLKYFWKKVVTHPNIFFQLLSSGKSNPIPSCVTFPISKFQL